MSSYNLAQVRMFVLMRGHTPCSSLLAAARSVLEVVAESMDGVPGRLPVLELPAEPRPPARLGGVRFFWERGRDQELG